MIRKLVIFIIFVLVLALAALYFNVQHGSIIILTQSTKITMNLMMGIILHYTLKCIAFLRSSPQNWRKYRQERSSNKHMDTHNKALLHTIKEEYNEAEYLFKQAYLNNTKKHNLDLLLAVNTALANEQTPKAQNDLDEIFSNDPQIKETVRYLQAKIYQKKQQPKSALTVIRQDKNYIKKPLVVHQLCQCLMDSGQYHELLAFLNQRSALNTDEKKNWSIQAHQHILDAYLSQNQITEACQYYEQLSSSYSRDPLLLDRYLQALMLDNQAQKPLTIIEKNFTTLITRADLNALATYINTTTEKNARSKLETLLNTYLQQAHTDKSHAYHCRAKLLADKQHYEKAIKDYQALISLNPCDTVKIMARLAICHLEHCKRHQPE